MRARVLVFAVVCGCSSSNAGNGTTMLSISVGGASPITLTVDPFAAQLPQSVSFLAMSSDATVFVSFGKSIAASSPMLTIGTAAGTATVFAKDVNVDRPLTAVTGTVALDSFDLSSAGQFAIRIVDAEKPTDTAGPSVRIDGSLTGSWDQIQ